MEGGLDVEQGDSLICVYYLSVIILKNVSIFPKKKSELKGQIACLGWFSF